MAWITVGGRTTAIVPSKQVLPDGIELKSSPKRRIATDGEVRPI